MTDIESRMAFYVFDDNEAIERHESKPIWHKPENYVLIHESDVVMLHNDMYECMEAFYLVLDHASRDDGDTRGYHANLSLIFKRLTRIGNLLDADLMKEQHKRGPGRNIQAVLIK